MKFNQKNRKALFALLLSLLMALSALAGCTKQEPRDIYILFTGDVHCADDENIGYAGLKAYKENLEQTGVYVTLVDTGDAVSGNFLAAQSAGEYIIELMNDVGYDLAVLGNHEFDYGIEQVSQLMALADATYLGCNITYSGKGENHVADLLPSKMLRYGKVDVAFIGVSTPESIKATAPIHFMEDGVFVYSFGEDATGEQLYATVQAEIDACRQNGAEYVVLLTHMGDGETFGAYASDALIAATVGVDAVLDGHAHNVIESREVEDKEGKSVLLASTGTELENIGQLVISAEGEISIGLVSDVAEKDAGITATIAAADAANEALLGEKVASSRFELPLAIDGVRVIRNREMPLGNLCADAFRAAAGADIGFANGGGIRAPLPAGDITYGDIVALQPYGNHLCMVTATGAEIADALEFAYRMVKVGEDGLPADESDNGAFLQVSGLKVTIDASIPSGVVVDETGMFVKVEGERRVKEILVEGADGTYAPLDPEQEYTVASHNFMLADEGDGYTMFSDNEFLITEGVLDCRMLIDYIKSFEGGVIPAQYETTQGRITIQS